MEYLKVRKDKSHPALTGVGVNFVFFGSDSIAIPVLEELEKQGFLPKLIVCSEDKEKGRGLKLTPPPSKLWAQERNIPVLQPKKLDDNFLSQLTAYSLQLAVVASYGKIIPESILNIFSKGILNVHPSLLPKLRGPSPIESTILYGEPAGVTIIKLDKEMDHGPIIAQKNIELGEKPPQYKKAEIILGSEGGKLLGEILNDYIEGKLELREQEHSGATFTKKITKDDGLIHLTDNAENNLKKIRAFEEWPTAYFFYDTKKGKLRIKIKTAHIENGELILDRVIPEGKKEMDWAHFRLGN